MTIELNVINLFCHNREAWERYQKTIRGIHNLEYEIRFLVEAVSQYYDKYPAVTVIEKQDLVTFLKMSYGTMKNLKVYLTLVDEVYALKANEELKYDLIEQILERHYAAELIGRLAPIIEGNSEVSLTSITPLVDEYIQLLRNPPTTAETRQPFSLSVVDLIEHRREYVGYPWFLHSLNEALGGAPRKHFGLVYAFVDSGKSSFCWKAASSFAQSIEDDQCILYCGNEEDEERMAFRGLQAFTGKTRTEIMNDPQSVQDEVIEKGWDKIKLFHPVDTMEEFEGLIKLYEPAIVFIDQLVKLEGVGTKSTKEQDKLGMLAKRVRDLAVIYNTSIIGVHQGAGDVENKKWLELGDLYNCRVAIQKELDYAIGIGKLTDNASDKYKRFFNIPKNKLFDGEGKKFVVHFETSTCQWVE